MNLPGMIRRCATIALALLAACAQAEAAAPPLSLHPDNPHYFCFRGRPAILIGSSEHYGAVLNLDFDYLPYLNELHSKGLNHTRTFSGTYREVPSSFGITGNTLAPGPNRYLAPWARSAAPGCDPRPKSQRCIAAWGLMPLVTSGLDPPGRWQYPGNIRIL